MDLLSKAKDLFTRRGGAEAAKEDMQEVKDVAQSDASMGDKAKEGFEAIKDPGATGEAQAPAGDAPAPAGESARPSAEERAPAAGEERPAGEEQRPPA